jgi:hypothetical protein
MMIQYVAASLCILLACRVAGADDARPIIGAIRWDAWHVGEKSSPVRAMERSLGPKQYHWRLPFFAKVVSDNEVKISGYTQEIVDREIAYAKAGGLDYWAFLLYDIKSPMSQGLSLYLSSTRRKDMPFCVIVGANILGDAEAFPEKMKRVVELMAEPGYRTVMGNRPLMYLFSVSDKWLEAWGGEANARKLFDAFRAAVRSCGLGDPYIVVMDFVPAHGKNVADAINAQAISSYAVAGGGKDAPYGELTALARDFWQKCADTGAQVVPTVMAGWDRRPRVEHPVPWEKYQKPGEDMDKFYRTPTPGQLALHIKEAMQWVAGKKDICPARAVIVYAWNEHDEGGWLCPTLNPDGSANCDRLDAIAGMLRGYK